MVLHPDKTKFMLFSRTGGEQDLNIFCNNNNSDQDLAENISVISRVSANDELPAIKFLGVFYPNLNFKYHISILKNNLSKALYALRTVKKTLNQKSLLLIYNSIFHCHLLYALQIWSCSKSGPINKIFKMQKKLLESFPAPPTMLIPNHFSRNCRSYPSLILFLSLKFNLCKDSSKKFYHHPLKKHGYLMTSETLDKMTFNCVIMIKFNLYIPPLQA